MIGIILASDGPLAAGIQQSSEMMFGKQTQVAAVTFMPSESLADLKVHLESAIAQFDQGSEILFLVDLWGSSPFNQINGMLKRQQVQGAMVTGLNLPLLLEAYASRKAVTSASALAAHLAAAGRAGIQVKSGTLTASLS